VVNYFAKFLEWESKAFNSANRGRHPRLPALIDKAGRASLDWTAEAAVPAGAALTPGGVLVVFSSSF
jgi:hypothetical protein